MLEALVAAAIEQKVTGKEAFAGYRTLVRRHGEAAPGPGHELGMIVPPDAASWARIPSWEWLRASVDSARSDTIMRALVKQTLGHTLVSTLADDIAQACEALAKKGGLHEHDRKRVKTGTGY